MACSDTIKNAFYALQNQISPRLYNRVSINDPWTAFTPRAEWPQGMGFTINSMLLERSTTDSETGTEWVAATASGSGDVATTANNCLPTPEILKFGQTLRSFTLSRRNIQTEDFCINDLMNDFQISRALANVANQLEFVTEWVWSNRLQNEYLSLCAHKVTEKASGFNISGTSFDFVGNPPTSRLINATLEDIYQSLILEGAIASGGAAVGKGVNDQPIFQLFTDAVTSRDLIRQDPDLRMDFRYADPDKLIYQLGTPYSYDGYKHVWIKFPPRYDTSGNRVYPYEAATATTKGWRREVSNGYKYAPYQVSFVHIPSVYTCLVERPDTSPGGGVKFNAASHMGDFTFRVILDKQCNPRGETGFFDALFASASEPGETFLGWAIAHLNCPPLRAPKSSCYS